jgi:chromosome partitioning protein
MLTVAFVNLKPGTGKTTGAVWLAHALAEAGHSVLLADADPAGSALRWSDLAGGFLPAIRLLPMPSKDLHHRLGQFAFPDDVVVIDAPQIEDNAQIARSALRVADEVVIPVAPTPIEVDRTAPMRDELETAASLRAYPPRACVLLNRCVANANSTADARESLATLGYHVLDYTVPRLELYAQSYGGPVPEGDPIWQGITRELLARARVEAAR